MTCTLQHWPQSRANVVCVTADGDIKWMRFWDPMVELTPSVTPSASEGICEVVTESHVAVVYRELSTDKWFLSTLNYEDGSPGVTHADLGITQDTASVTIGATPLRTEIHISVLDTANEEMTVHGIQSNGTVTSGTSMFDNGDTRPFIMPNGEAVAFGSSGGMQTVVVTDQTGEVWRATDFAETFGGQSGRFGVAMEDSTSSGVMYFMLASGGTDMDPEWEWWKLDSVANTVTRTGAAGSSFTSPRSPVDMGSGHVAKGSSGKVWIFHETSLSERVELRDIIDDDGDVLATIVPSDFDTGGHSFDFLNVIGGVGREALDRPGRMIDATGRFYVSARESGVLADATRALSCSESDVRRYSDVKDGPPFASNGPVVIADGEVVFVGRWEESVSPTDDENGNSVDILQMIEAFSPGASTLDTLWGWNGSSQGGASVLHPLVWTTDDGDVVLFNFPSASNLFSPTFATRYVRRGTRMLDVTRFAP